MAGKDPKGRLLEAAIAHIASRGVSDLSLRELAAAIGTSHRMLIHHFGGRDGLWVEVIRAVEERQRAAFAEVVPEPGMSVGDVMRQWWRHISDPSLWPNERLFFELYGQALQGRPGAVELLDGIVDAWIEPAAASFDGLRAGARGGARAGAAGRSRSAAGCCSTCWRPRTARRSTPRWTPTST